jgi:TonB family protein
MAAMLPVAGPVASSLEETTAGAIIHAIGIEPGGGFAWLLIALWLPGFLIALSLLLSGARAFRLVSSRSLSVLDPASLRMMQTLRRAYGIGRPVRLMQSPGNGLPLTWGVFRPCVLLPDGASEWADTRKFAVLAHELAHIRRADWLFRIAAEICCAIYWFHPLFWVARNRLLLESERACDDAVLRQGVEGQDYARHLLDVARALKQTGPGWSPAMARPVHLERRLATILNPAVKRQAVSFRTVLVTVVFLACLGIPLAAMRAPAPLASSDSPATGADSTAQAHVVQYTTPPLYSDEALRQKIEGTVRVEAQVGVDGRVSNLRILNALGFGLDQNALLAVRDWRFAPAVREGKPVDSTMEIDVEFSLLNAELNDMIANDMATQVGPDVVPPRIVRRAEPAYPSLAEGRTGSVLLDVVIQENGVPRIVRVLRSLTWQFDEAAIAALEQWRFSPASQSGVPVKVRMSVEIPFVLPRN